MPKLDFGRKAGRQRIDRCLPRSVVVRASTWGILVIALVIGTGCIAGPAARDAKSLVTEVAEHFKPPLSVVDRPPPRFVAPKFTSTELEASSSLVTKIRVKLDEQDFAAEFGTKLQDVSQIICNVYGYFAQPKNPLPTDDEFSNVIAYVLIKRIPESTSLKFRNASNDLLDAIKAARMDQVDSDGVRNASIAAVCDIV